MRWYAEKIRWKNEIRECNGRMWWKDAMRECNEKISWKDVMRGYDERIQLEDAKILCWEIGLEWKTKQNISLINRKIEKLKQKITIRRCDGRMRWENAMGRGNGKMEEGMGRWKNSVGRCNEKIQWVNAMGR